MARPHAPCGKNASSCEKINGVFYFLNIFYFVIFCRMRYFKFLNSVLIKTLEMDSSFFRIFYFKKFKNFQFDRSIFQKLMKLVPVNFSGFHENRSVFE
jgi:membrane-anchored protein YejM (alkaline phosphatase superfamily)